MVLNLKDLWQAINNVQLELMITGIILVILFSIGLIMGLAATWYIHRSTISQLTASEDVNPKHTFSTQVDYIAPLTTEMWKQRQLKAKSQESLTYESPEVNTRLQTWWANFWQGLSTEFFGAAIITIFLGIFVLIIQQYQWIQNTRQQFVLQLHNYDQEIVQNGVAGLISYGWLQDGSLNGIDLRRVNFSYIIMRNANLAFTDISSANLERVDLHSSNLEGIILTASNLNNANFYAANLKSSEMSDTNLLSANLNAANLIHANLSGAILEGVWLPDNTKYGEHNDDVNRFTNPHHPDFWNPCIELTPMPWYCTNYE